MRCDLARPASPWIFATDAEGPSDDAGGFGIVLAPIPVDLSEEVLCTCPRAGRTVANLDGSFAGMRRHQRELDARIATSRIPPRVFDLSWMDFMGRRWRKVEHIIILEARATNILLEILARLPSAHRHCFASLQDNEAWSSASAKERSPNPVLNFILRKRAALLLMTEIDMDLPWTDTQRQPADRLSRTRPSFTG